MRLADITTEDISTLVGLLTIEQKEQLLGQWYAPDSYYNPILDASDNWVVSVEEMQSTVNPKTLWVKELELIVYVPKDTENEPEN